MTAVHESVDDYIEQYRQPASRELDYFRRVPRTDEEAVRRAALAQLPGGKLAWTPSWC